MAWASGTSHDSCITVTSSNKLDQLTPRGLIGGRWWDRTTDLRLVRRSECVGPGLEQHRSSAFEFRRVPLREPVREPELLCRGYADFAWIDGTLS